MSGVCGWVGLADPAVLKRMLDAIDYRFRPGYLECLLQGRLAELIPRHGANIRLLLTLESWLRGHGF